MIDTHCHLTFDDYAGRVDQVLADARAAGVWGCITVATSAANARACLALAQTHADVWCTAGMHPLYADEGELDLAVLEEVGRHPRCVAWGELGLDNHYDRPPRPIQDRILDAQLRFVRECDARGLRKPVVVHCRDAFDELIPQFRDSAIEPERFVFHCFTGGPAEAEEVLDFGAWISFTGVVTFRNARGVAEAARLVPSDRLMVETDAPFLSPEPVRTVRPNEPKHVVHIARFLAHLRGVDPVELETQLDVNAQQFFGIERPE